MITINLDDNNNDTSKVDKDVFQCLFKEINDHLENSKNNINIEKINEFKNSIEKIKSETIDKKTNLVLVGDFNSGKTTCCNSLIASLVDNQFKPWSTYDDFLVSANTENTYFITVVESSDSNKFSLEHYVDNKLIKNITVRADDVEEIKTYLIDLDNKSTEKLKEIAEIEAKRIEDPNFKGKVPMTIVKVKIPGFSEKFRIIDIPGMTSSTLRDRFFNFLEEKCLVNIFLIIRSLVHTKVSDPDFVITTNNICSTYPNSLSLLILTKVDELIKEKKDRNLKKYQDNLKEFLTYFGEKCTSLKNYGTFIVSCKEALEDNEIYKNGIIKLKNNIKNLEHTFAEKQKMNSLITRLKHCFNEFNSSNTELNNIFDIDEVDEVRSASVISCCKLQDNIIKWINITAQTIPIDLSFSGYYCA